MAFETKTKFNGMIKTETFAEGAALLITDLVKIDPTGKAAVYDVLSGESITIADLIADLAKNIFRKSMTSIEIELEEDEDGRAETIWVN